MDKQDLVAINERDVGVTDGWESRLDYRILWGASMVINPDKSFANQTPREWIGVPTSQ
jgi:hypothetical protein